MIALLLALASCQRPKVVKLLSAQEAEDKLHTNLDGYMELNESVWSLIRTVLFEDGHCLNEINCLSDAIIHCRSGCGADVPGGDGLTAEMLQDEALDTYMFTTNSTIENKAVTRLMRLEWGKADGKTEWSQHTPAFNCQTLGGYSGDIACEMHSSCVYDEEGASRKCRYAGRAQLTGFDRWDFDTHPEWPWWRNLIREWIPEWLVRWRGTMKEFNTTFDLTKEYKGSFVQFNAV